MPSGRRSRVRARARAPPSPALDWRKNSAPKPARRSTLPSKLCYNCRRNGGITYGRTEEKAAGGPCSEHLEAGAIRQPRRPQWALRHGDQARAAQSARKVNHTDPRPLQAHPLKADDPTSLEPDQGPSASSLQQTPSSAATCCACISSCPIRAISSLLASLAELFR